MKQNDAINVVHFDDCRTTMRAMAAAGVRVQTCVTSPPYYGLRDYGVDGQIGLEETPEQFIAAMVEVFRCVRDVLADDGTLWINIGDSYATSGCAPTTAMGEGVPAGWTNRAQDFRTKPTGSIKPKDLMGIPWMLAFALRADGWYLRQDIIWHKPNPMPESVTDRCTKAHEYIFLFSKSPRYFYDHEGVKEPAVGAANTGVGWGTTSRNDPRDGRTDRARSRRDSFKRDNSKREQAIPGQSVGTHRTGRDESDYDLATRNRRSVWSVATRPYKGAHFATFPPALIEPCVLAGTSEKGHCPECGARWMRQVNASTSFESGSGRAGTSAEQANASGKHVGGIHGANNNLKLGPVLSTVTTGWAPTCECGCDPVTDTVLDTFMGSGTTAEVAILNGRNYVGCELNEDYKPLQDERISSALAEFAQANAPTPQLDLFADMGAA